MRKKERARVFSVEIGLVVSGGVGSHTRRVSEGLIMPKVQKLKLELYKYELGVQKNTSFINYS